MNFELILTGLTALCFVFWLIHKFIFTNKLVDFFQSFFGVLLVVLIIRSFLFEPFRIPSSSMRPTLVIGDFVLVNKFTYGPRLPVLRNKLWEGNAPARGDIIVFKFPEDPRVDYIKRVVGLPGDKIETRGRALLINDRPVVTQKIAERTWQDGVCNQYTSDIMKAQMPGKTHNVYHMRERMVQRDKVQVIPPGKYFVMGDNRDNSRDSRFWGFVDEGLIVGKAQAIWMNIDWAGGCGKGVQLHRIGGVESNG